jgi:hypothetical protein
MLLFAYDMAILQESKDNSWKSIYELRKPSNIYNVKISTMKEKVRLLEENTHFCNK